MRRRIWQFLLPIHHDVSSDRAWWLPYREPCVSCQSSASAGLGSPGDSRSHSRHVGNTRRRRLITCCLLWPAAWRFWLGLHLVNMWRPIQYLQTLILVPFFCRTRLGILGSTLLYWLFQLPGLVPKVDPLSYELRWSINIIRHYKTFWAFNGPRKKIWPDFIDINKHGG